MVWEWVLSICQTIVEAHGGLLTAAPNDPHGMDFRSFCRFTSTGQINSLDRLGACRG